jgi:putative Mg2+ transporter-C (MgtC) family protein
MLNGQPIPEIYIELIGPVNMYLGMGVLIATTVLLGGLVGWEREMRGKAAGIKTNILICLGSCLYTVTSLLNVQSASLGDPNRVAAQIVSGIGFLGAGAIIQGKGGVTGLTTAATIWTVAAIGVCVGYGFPLSAALFTMTVLVVLRILEPLFTRIEPHDNVHLVVEGRGDLAASVESVLQLSEASIFHSIKKVLDKKVEMHYYMRVSVKHLRYIESELRQMSSIRKVHHQKLIEIPTFAAEADEEKSNQET